jgi:hypothetical protein
MTRWTICRKLASLFWKSFEIPKKRVVASFVGNFSPVYRRRAILVRRTRHLRGCIGEELKSRAISVRYEREWRGALLTFLKDRGPIHTHYSLVGIFIFLAVTHDGLGKLPSFMNCRKRCWFRYVRGYQHLEVATLAIPLWEEHLSERKVLA